MAKVDFVPVDQAKLLTRRLSPRELVLEEYKGYVEKLTSETAGRLSMEENDRPATIRNRLLRAAKALGKEIEIRRVKNEIFFWLKS